MIDQKTALDKAIEAFKRYKSGKLKVVKPKTKTGEKSSGAATESAESRR